MSNGNVGLKVESNSREAYLLRKLQEAACDYRQKELKSRVCNSSDVLASRESSIKVLCDTAFEYGFVK